MTNSMRLQSRLTSALVRITSVLIASLLTLSWTGCGLVFLGPRHEVRLKTNVAGSTGEVNRVSPATLPATISFPRRDRWLVIRASADGHRPSCEIYEGDRNNLFVFLDAIPLALPLLVDHIAGALYEYPAEVSLTLDKLEEDESATEMVNTSVILDVARAERLSQAIELCTGASVPIIPDEVRSATHSIALVRVDRPTNPADRYSSVKTIRLASKSADKKSKETSAYRYTDRQIDLFVVAEHDQIALQIRNLTPHAAKVLWDEVTFVDWNRTSNRVMHMGVAFRDRYRSTPGSVIAPNSSLVDAIVPVNRISEGFERDALMPAYRYCHEGAEEFVDRINAVSQLPFSLLLPIEIQGTVNEYTLTFKVERSEFIKGSECTPPPLVKRTATLLTTVFGLSTTEVDAAGGRLEAVPQ